MADEPAQITIGDSVTWTKSLTNYPPSAGWSLAYSASRTDGANGEEPISISSTGSGSVFTVDLAATATVDWTAGSYILNGYVTKVSARHVVSTTLLSILPDPTAALGSTHATRTLAIIEAALENRLPRGLEQYTIDGQNITKMPIEMLSRLRDKYAGEVRAAQDKARVAAGLPSRRNSYARFSRVR